MAKKKDNHTPKSAAARKEAAERKLLEKHPFETMSQVQNRYGRGRERSDSDGTNQEANRLNH